MSTELHVSAHESHHQAYKYCTIKMKNVQLLAGLYTEISCISQSQAHICTMIKSAVRRVQVVQVYLGYWPGW